MKKEFLEKLKKNMNETMNKAAKPFLALMAGATVGVLVSFTLAKCSADSTQKYERQIAISESEKKDIELAAIEHYKEELSTSSDRYTELLDMLKSNVQNNPSRYQGIVEDTQQRIEELEEEIGILRRLN